jgi:CheY-like chemotaxis protein
MINTVIIIDDDPVSILVSKTMMKKNGFGKSIVTFDNAAEALDYLNGTYNWDEGPPSFIFVDIHMPSLDGWTFVKKYKDLRGDAIDTPHVVLLSATVNPEDFKKVKAERIIAELIVKPVGLDILDRLKNK